MIVEISDGSFSKPLLRNGDTKHASIYHLDEVFNKLALPRPDINEVQRTHEKGFNLFLNHYGCVVRMYTRQRGEKKAFSGCSYGHIYHPKSLPPIGAVHMPEFNIQIMPGLIPYNRKVHDHADAIQKNFVDTLGTNHDSGERNLGFISDNHTAANDLMLLDTIFPIFSFDNKYNKYLGTSVELMQKRSEFISDLQDAFYKAWTNDNPAYMKNFWHKCRVAHLGGDRLCSGWLDEDNSTLSMTNRGKGDFVQKSLDYDDRLQKFLKP